MKFGEENPVQVATLYYYAAERRCSEGRPRSQADICDPAHRTDATIAPGL